MWVRWRKVPSFDLMHFYGFMAQVEICSSPFPTASPLCCTWKDHVHTRTVYMLGYVSSRHEFIGGEGSGQPSMRSGVPATSINGPRDEHQQASLRRDRPHPAKHQVTRYTAKRFRHPLSQNKYRYRLSWNLFRRRMLRNRFRDPLLRNSFRCPLRFAYTLPWN